MRTGKDPLPYVLTVSEALRDIGKDTKAREVAEKEFEGEFDRQRIEAEREYTKLQGLRDHFRHKKHWSNFLMLIMGFMVCFQSLLIVCVGVDWWNFRDYEWLLPTLMIQYLLQIVGLATFVVRSLFKDVQ